MRTTDWEKVKVGRGGGEGGRAPQTRPGDPRRERRGHLGPPRAPLAASGVGSSGLPPSPAHCSFAGRRGNCLLIAEVRGRGSGRGSAGQNGSVGRAARCRPPPPLASAAGPGRQQHQRRRRRPPRVVSPEASALRPRGALSARNKWSPLRRPSGPPRVPAQRSSQGEPLSAMRSHGAGLALWTALSLLQVRGPRRGPRGRNFFLSLGKNEPSSSEPPARLTARATVKGNKPPSLSSCSGEKAAREKVATLLGCGPLLWLGGQRMDGLRLGARGEWSSLGSLLRTRLWAGLDSGLQLLFCFLFRLDWGSQ